MYRYDCQRFLLAVSVDHADSESGQEYLIVNVYQCEEIGLVWIWVCLSIDKLGG